MSTPQPPDPNRSGAVAGLLSAIVPGWGQAYLGRGRSAFGLLLVDLLLVGSALLVVARFQLEVLKAWVSPGWLLVIMVGNLALLAYRATAAGAAHRAGARPERAARALPVLAATVLLLIAPHLMVGYAAWTQYDLITTVFGPSPPVAGATTTSSIPATTGETPITTVPQTATTTTQPPRIWDGVERLNIALLGSDMRPNQETLDPNDRRYVGHRTDVMIVVSINPEPPYDVALFSVPRFLSNYEMPDGMGVPMSLDEWDWMGHVYRRAEDIAPASYPGPGSPGENAVKAALGELFGIDVHYYALITVRGFIELIDALGGVTIDVPTRIVDGNYDTADDHWGATRTTIVIESGSQHLDGYHALAYARIRSQSHEFARMQRQRCIIAALVEQTNPIELLFNLGPVAEAIKANVKTDIPQGALADFVDLLPNLDTGNFTTLNIARSAYEIPAPNHLIRYFDITQIREDAQLVMRDPLAAREALGLSALDTTCEESLDP